MWLTQDDLMQLGFKQRTIRHYIQSGRWESRDSGVRGRNGKELREVLLDSLPLKLQASWNEFQISNLKSENQAEKRPENPTAQNEIRRASGAQNGAQIQRRAVGSEEFAESPVNTNVVEFQAKSNGAKSNGAPPDPARNENPIRRANPTARTVETWLTKSDIAGLGVNLGTLQNRIKAGTWKSRIGAVRGSRNGTPLREILLESLPQELQLKWWKVRREEISDLRSEISEFDEDDAIDREIPNNAPGEIDHERRLVESLKKYETDVRDAFLAEAQRLAAIVERYDAIEVKRQKVKSKTEPAKAGTPNNKYEFVPTVLRLCEEAKCTDAAVLRIEPSRAKSRSPHTLDQWTKAYREFGLAAFLRKPAQTQNDNTDKRKAVVSAPAIEWVNSIWRNYPSPRHLYKALQKQAAKNGWVIPAESWIRRKYKSLPKVVSTLVFQGEKAYTGKYAPFVPRDYRDLEALQVLCGDHSVRDVTVMLPSGELTRPWLTVWLCLRTYLIWGWHLDLTPSSNTIGLAYADGVRNFGAQPLSNPDAEFFSYLYTDQGKDYKSKSMTGKILVFKNAAAIEGGLNALCIQRKVGFMDEMGLKHLMARGYNGREKPVERIFRDFSDWEQNYFEAEYCGRDAKNKPDAWVRAWHRHQKLLKKFGGGSEALKAESPFISFDDYRENLAGFINEFNNKEHQRAVLGGAKIVPMDEYQRLYTTSYEISEDALALFLMKTPDKPRKITKDGIQMFQSHWFFLHEDMSEFKGESVEVRYTDGDYSRIWAVLPNGRVVCASLVTPTSLLNPNKKTMETVKRQAAHERTMGREWLFVQQSNWRGETTEDRVAAQINEPDEFSPERQKIAVNAGPRIHNLTRFDSPKLAGSSRPTVTTEQVERANVIEGMFRPEPEKKIKEEWED